MSITILFLLLRTIKNFFLFFNGTWYTNKNMSPKFTRNKSFPHKQFFSCTNKSLFSLLNQIRDRNRHTKKKKIHIIVFQPSHFIQYQAWIIWKLNVHCILSISFSSLYSFTFYNQRFDVNLFFGSHHTKIEFNIISRYCEKCKSPFICLCCMMLVKLKFEMYDWLDYIAVIIITEKNYVKVVRDSKRRSTEKKNDLWKPKFSNLHFYNRF